MLKQAFILNQSKYFFMAIALAYLLANSFMAFADELPPRWPWRGISIDAATKDNGPEYVKYLKDKGFNSIELILSVRHTAQFKNMSPGMAWKQNLFWANSMLDECKLNDMSCILTFVQFPIDPKLNITQSSPEFWESEQKRSELLLLVEELARNFSSRGSELAAYEILNEPLIQSKGQQRSPEAWLTLANQIISSIRKYDANRFIVLNAGLGGEAGKYRNFSPFEDGRIIYGAHVYNPHNYTHQGIASWKNGVNWPSFINGVYWDKSRLERELKPLADFKDKYNVPVWIGEFSVVRWAPNASDWLCDAVSLFKKFDFSWTYFSFNGFHGWNPAYNNNYPGQNNEYWKLDRVGEGSERWKVLNKILRNECS